MTAAEYSCKVISSRMLTPTVFELAFETERPLALQAGQFLSVVIPGAGPKGRDLRRAYSIASPPEARPIELCVKLVEEGPGTNYLRERRPGETFRGFAPYGDFVYDSEPHRKVAFIATGTGIAPFRAMVLSHAYQAAPPASHLCILGVRTEDELLYDETFSRQPRIRWVPAISQPRGEWEGFRGRVTDYLRSHAAEIDWGGTDFYLCGNGQMITEVKALLLEKGVAKEAIRQEKYY
ncbi:MAG: FAD-dependent oxidoreductase [Oligoflexia bacterium]|nr:FAD-dependent oxidoreductase [Oligoflexia bacterium]